MFTFLLERWINDHPSHRLCCRCRRAHPIFPPAAVQLCHCRNLQALGRQVHWVQLWVKKSSIFLLTASMYVMMIVIIIMKHNESFRDIFILPQISLTYFYLVSETPSLYENNHYHEECLKCNSCGMNLSGANQKRARRFKNQILCDLHFADMALMESSDFMQQLRNFKPQSLGCAVARRKSSTTLIFPLPPQACSGILTLNFFTWKLKFLWDFVIPPLHNIFDIWVTWHILQAFTLIALFKTNFVMVIHTIWYRPLATGLNVPEPFQIKGVRGLTKKGIYKKSTKESRILPMDHLEMRR